MLEDPHNHRTDPGLTLIVSHFGKVSVGKVLGCVHCCKLDFSILTDISDSVSFIVLITTAVVLITCPLLVSSFNSLASHTDTHCLCLCSQTGLSYRCYYKPQYCFITIEKVCCFTLVPLFHG